MARPYFTGDYGSALARVDTRPIIEAGRAQGQMYAQMGKDIGGVIKEYGLNKQKRAELTNKIESTIKLNPDYMTRMTSTGIEADDKKAQTLQDKLTSGNANMTELKGLAGELAMMEAQDLKAITEETRAYAREGAEQNRRLVELNIKGKELSNKASIALEKLQTETRDKEQNALNQYTSQIHDIEALVASGTKPKDLNPNDQWLIVNKVAILNGQMPAGSFVVDRNFRMTAAQQEAILKKTNLEIERAKGEIKDDKTERAPGEYANLAAVNAELKRQFDKGFIATAVAKPDGTWNITKSVPIAEAKNDLIPIPGHPDVYRFQDSSELFLMPPGETPRKIGVGEGTEARLKQVYLSYFNDGTAKWYAEAMRSGELEDGVYTWDDSEGIERTVPYDSDMETKVRRIEELEKELEGQIFELPPAPPPPAWYNNPPLQ